MFQKAIVWEVVSSTIYYFAFFLHWKKKTEFYLCSNVYHSLCHDIEISLLFQRWQYKRWFHSALTRRHDERRNAVTGSCTVSPSGTTHKTIHKNWISNLKPFDFTLILNFLFLSFQNKINIPQILLVQSPSRNTSDLFIRSRLEVRSVINYHFFPLAQLKEQKKTV